MGKDPAFVLESKPEYFCSEKYGMHSHIADLCRTALDRVLSLDWNKTCVNPGSMKFTVLSLAGDLNLTQFRFTSDSNLIMPLCSASERPEIFDTSSCSRQYCAPMAQEHPVAYRQISKIHSCLSNVPT
jgi:hypothetical protein